MDTKNVIAAISLSAAVIVLYSLFFQPDPETIKQNLAEQKKIENNTDTPSIDKNENFKILDVNIDGVSMLVTQRAEFMSVIKNNPKGVIGLIEAMDAKISG